MFSQDRDSLRRFFLSTWRKASNGEPLEPLEAQIAGIIRSHPEYHALLSDEESALTHESSPASGDMNPFLHLSLHLALLEQLETDRPTGIRGAYQAVASALSDPHQAEHRIMDCLSHALWEAQRAGRPPDEGRYLECVRGLLRTTGKPAARHR